MNIAEVKSLLEANKNERGIKHWEKTNIPWTSYGIGLIQLKKLAKTIGKDHDLAIELWKEKNYDMVTLSTLIDEPAKVTRTQVEEQLKKLDFWMLSHSYCSNLLARVAFQKELSEEWIDHEDKIKRRVAYLLIYNIARDEHALEDEYFEPIIEKIHQNLQTEENFIKDAMNNALIMIGSRSAFLNENALRAARHIGLVVVDYGDNSCKALHAETHLMSKRIRNKLRK